MLPLEGIKVLDFTLLLPGYYTTMLLADMGAEVIKILEVKKRFEAARDLLPPGVEASDVQIAAGYFAERNKKSVALNLKDEEARNVLYRIVEGSDVIVEAFRPGVMKRLGADYETIKKINPRIVYCSLSGYGQDGPYRDLPGHDYNYQALSGVLMLNRSDEGHPVLGIPLADLSGGIHAGFGILLALIAREKTGNGQYIDISMTDVMFSWAAVSPLVRNYFITGRSPKVGDGASHFVFETKDGKDLLIAPVERWFWERLCRNLGVEEYIPYHKDFLFYESSKRKEMVSCFAQIFLTKTRDEWFNILRDADIAVGSIHTSIEEVLQEPQLIYRQMITEFNDPKLGRVRQSGIPIKLSDTPGEIRSLMPFRGQHTREVLLQVGYTEKEIEEMIRKGAIYCA